MPANAGADKEPTAADQGQRSLESPTNVPSEREGDTVTTMEDNLSEQKGPEDMPGNESREHETAPPESQASNTDAAGLDGEVNLDHVRRKDEVDRCVEKRRLEGEKTG